MIIIFVLLIVILILTVTIFTWNNGTMSRCHGLTLFHHCNSWITTRMTVLQFFPPEICSLICQDSTLERLDLNSSDSTVATGLPLGPRRHHTPHMDSGQSYICVNLKELAMPFEDCHRHQPGLLEPEYSPWHMLALYRFKLTKFVNGYFSQENSLRFALYLRSQTNLESLELHSGRTSIFKSQISLRKLKSLDCPPQFLDTIYRMTRLRLGFEKISNDCETDALGRVCCAGISPETWRAWPYL